MAVLLSDLHDSPPAFGVTSLFIFRDFDRP
jgi:hypothetical protein